MQIMAKRAPFCTNNSSKMSVKKEITAASETKNEKTLVGGQKQHSLTFRRSKAILDFPFEGRSCLFKDEKTFPQAEVSRSKTSQKKRDERMHLSANVLLGLHRGVTHSISFSFPKGDDLQRLQPGKLHARVPVHTPSEAMRLPTLLLPETRPRAQGSPGIRLSEEQDGVRLGGVEVPGKFLR